MTKYTIIRRFNKDLIVVKESHYGTQLWVTCKLRSRRGKNCEICRGVLKKSARGRLAPEAFRPITNKGNRYHRICISCGRAGFFNR